MSKVIYYAVMKLLTEIAVKDFITGNDVNVKINGCAGYMPIFKTLKKARKHANNEKYRIVALTIGEAQNEI